MPHNNLFAKITLRKKRLLRVQNKKEIKMVLYK